MPSETRNVFIRLADRPGQFGNRHRFFAFCWQFYYPPPQMAGESFLPTIQRTFQSGDGQCLKGSRQMRESARAINPRLKCGGNHFHLFRA